MEYVVVFLFAADLILLMSSIEAYLDGKGIKRYMIWTLCIVSISATVFLMKYSSEQEIMRQTETTEDIRADDDYQFRIGEKIDVKFLTRSDEKYKISYVGDRKKIKWMSIREEDGHGILVEVKYDENRKTAEFVREKNFPKKDGGYKRHYVLYIGNETALSSSEHTEGTDVKTTVQDDIIQKK